MSKPRTTVTRCPSSDEEESTSHNALVTRHSLVHASMTRHLYDDFENIPSPDLSSEDESDEPSVLETSFYPGLDVSHIDYDLEEEVEVTGAQDVAIDDSQAEDLENEMDMTAEVARRSSIGSSSSMASLPPVTFDEEVILHDSSSGDPLDIHPSKVVHFCDISTPNDIVCDREEWNRINAISDREERHRARKREITRMAKQAIDPIWIKGGLERDVYKKSLKRIVHKTLMSRRLVSRAFVSKCVNYEVQKSLENVMGYADEE